jgi:hypothetical protein
MSGTSTKDLSALSQVLSFCSWVGEEGQDCRNLGVGSCQVMGCAVQVKPQPPRRALPLVSSWGSALPSHWVLASWQQLPSLFGETNYEDLTVVACRSLQKPVEHVKLTMGVSRVGDQLPFTGNPCNLSQTCEPVQEGIRGNLEQGLFLECSTSSRPCTRALQA